MSDLLFLVYLLVYLFWLLSAFECTLIFYHRMVSSISVPRFHDSDNTDDDDDDDDDAVFRRRTNHDGREFRLSRRCGGLLAQCSLPSSIFHIFWAPLPSDISTSELPTECRSCSYWITMLHVFYIHRTLEATPVFDIVYG